MDTKRYTLSCDKQALLQRLTSACSPEGAEPGRIISFRHGGFNANSGAIASFIFAVPAVLPILAVGTGIGATLLTSRLLKHFLQND